MEIHSAGFVRFPKLRHLVCALAMVLLAGLTLVPAYAKDCDYQTKLTAEEQNQAELGDALLDGLTEERYYLTLDGEFLVSAEREEDLTGLLVEVASRYVTENTVSSLIKDENRLGLYHGAVGKWESTDLAAAEETLQDTLTVITVEETVTDEAIPYEEVRIEDPERYEDEEPEVTEGYDGLEEITTHTVRENGEEVSTKVASTRVLVEPVDEVTTVGTKVRVEYIWPVSGKVSSHFGRRNISGGSKNHKGVDIAVPKGTEVAASKDGTVIFSGWNGGYGYLIKIDHGDGTVTYYAHNSELLAKKGDVVEQGDIIALSGSTGQSTGPHCHFEIRIDGTPVNPEDYLGER